MGYADRDYQRPFRVEDEHPEVEGYYARWIYLLAAALLAEFAVSRGLEPDDLSRFTAWMALDPDRVLSRPWQVLTYAFLHHDLWILVIGLVFLVAFGRPVEGRLGAGRFYGIFFGGALGSAVAFLLIRRIDPGLSHFTLQGATGGLLAVLVVFAALFPEAEVPFVLYRMPSWLFVATALALYGFYCVRAGTAGLAQASHFAGALAGGLYIWGRPALASRLPVALRPARRPAVARREFAAREFDENIAGVRPEPAASPRPPEVEKEVDRILAKIAGGGLVSLTEPEKKYLSDASRLYKKSPRPNDE